MHQPIAKAEFLRLEFFTTGTVTVGKFRNCSCFLETAFSISESETKVYIKTIINKHKGKRITNSLINIELTSKGSYCDHVLDNKLRHIAKLR